MSHVMNTYARLPVAFSHGDGSWVTDTDGRIYLDALSGIAVSTLGHNHPELVAAIAAQAGRLLHTSNLYRMPQQEQLADKLTALAELHRIAENYGRTDRAARILNLFDWLFGPEGQTDYTEYEQTVLPTE